MKFTDLDPINNEVTTLFGEYESAILSRTMRKFATYTARHAADLSATQHKMVEASLSSLSKILDTPIRDGARAVRMKIPSVETMGECLCLAQQLIGPTTVPIILKVNPMYLEHLSKQLVSGTTKATIHKGAMAHLTSKQLHTALGS